MQLIKIDSKAQTTSKENTKLGYKRALDFKEKLVFETPSKKQKQVGPDFNEVKLSIKSVEAQE